MEFILNLEYLWKPLTAIVVFATIIVSAIKSVIELKTTLLKMRIESEKATTTTKASRTQSFKMFRKWDFIFYTVAIAQLTYYFISKPLNGLTLFTILITWTAIGLLIGLRLHQRVYDWIIKIFDEHMELQRNFIEYIRLNKPIEPASKLETDRPRSEETPPHSEE